MRKPHSTSALEALSNLLWDAALAEVEHSPAGDEFMMRIFPPLAADHPIVTDKTVRCAKCHEGFKAGDRTTLIPLDLTGQGGTVRALPAHARCVGLDEATHFACRFCIAMKGLKGRDIPQMPLDAAVVETHVRTEHQYPRRSALRVLLDVLPDSAKVHLAARIIEDQGPVIKVSQLPTDLDEIESPAQPAEGT